MIGSVLGSVIGLVVGLIVIAVVVIVVVVVDISFCCVSQCLIWRRRKGRKKRKMPIYTEPAMSNKIKYTM